MTNELEVRVPQAEDVEKAFSTILKTPSIDVEGATLANVLLLLRRVVNSQNDALLLVGKAVTQELSGDDLRKSADDIEKSLRLIDDVTIDLSQAVTAHHE